MMILHPWRRGGTANQLYQAPAEQPPARLTNTPSLLTHRCVPQQYSS